MGNKRFVIGVLLTSFSSLLYFDILITDFRVTFAVVALGVFLYLYRRVDPILVGVIIAVTTFTLRILFFALQYGNWGSMVAAFLPETVFYVAYAALFKLTIYRQNMTRLEELFGVALLGDFLSNVGEVSIRVAFLEQAYSMDLFSTLFLVAAVRAVMFVVILKAIAYYRLLLIREDHEMRYHRLIHMTMLLRDEMYWFEKNKVRIENSMARAYRLFEQLRREDEGDLAEESLAIAGDIHEIKKEYELVLRGFKQITEVEYEISQMRFSDMIRILEKTLGYDLEDSGRKIDIRYHLENDFSTTSHFELMSILRNLISNSIDSVGNKGKIQVDHFKRGSLHYFVVEDNGTGLQQDVLDEIFRPGYSTKIDYETGEINRGLGLSLVKSLVENHFGGTISVTSEPGRSTRFSIKIEETELEGSS